MIERVYNCWNYYTKIRLPSITCERYLVIWQPNHLSKIHGHNGKKCNFYLLKGNLRESLYDNSKNFIQYNRYTNFLDKGYIDDTIGVHSIRNLSDKYSYSYHVYK